MLSLDGHRDYRNAVPTPGHFMPMLYLAGIASADGRKDTEILVDGYSYGALSMTSYMVGMPHLDTPETGPSPSRPPPTPGRSPPTSEDAPALSRRSRTFRCWGAE